MRALIVDDEPLARNELIYLLNRIGGFDVLDEAENVSETIYSDSSVECDQSTAY